MQFTDPTQEFKVIIKTCFVRFFKTIKNGAVSLSPRNNQNAWGKDTRLRNYLESDGATVDPLRVFKPPMHQGNAMAHRDHIVLSRKIALKPCRQTGLTAWELVDREPVHD